MKAPPGQPPPVARRRFRFALLGILAAALALRAWGLQGQSLFCDEIVEASIARLPTEQIIAYPDGFPPLYHLMLAAWSRALPAPESGRWLSVVLGVATVYAAARWARQSAGPAAGLFAGLLAAVSPLLIYLSQEMRAYSAYVCFASFVLMYYFEAMASDGRRSWSAFAASSILAVNTHYYAALLVALLALVFAVRRLSEGPSRRGAEAFAAVAIGCVPALLLLPGDMAYQSAGFAAKAPLAATLGHTAYAFFAGFSLGPSLTELHLAAMGDALRLAAPWAGLFAVAGGWLLWQGWLELRQRPLGGALVLLAVASAPIIGVAGELAGVGPKVRYWSWILTPLLVWLAVGAARGRRGRLRWPTLAALAAIVAGQALAIGNRRYGPAYANEDVRAAAAYLQAHSSRKTPVFVVADYMAPPVRYYLNGARSLYGWLPHGRGASADDDAAVPTSGNAWIVFPRSEADVRGAQPFDQAAINQWLAAVRSLASEDGFWLLYSREYHGDPGGTLLAYLQQAGLVALDREFPGVRLYRGQLPDPAN